MTPHFGTQETCVQGSSLRSFAISQLTDIMFIIYKCSLLSNKIFFLVSIVTYYLKNTAVKSSLGEK